MTTEEMLAEYERRLASPNISKEDFDECIRRVRILKDLLSKQ